MNLILCNAQDIAGTTTSIIAHTPSVDNNNNQSQQIVVGANNTVTDKNSEIEKFTKKLRSQTKKSLMKSKPETMNHSDGGGGNNDIDDLSDDPSSPESDDFNDSDLLASASQDEVTAQLAAAGPVGIAAAAAIATAKKRKRPHSFETNPSIRKRQQTRLLRKLKQTMDEYTTRVGQQAVVLIVTPGKPQNNFKVFGARPLETVVRQCRPIIMQELETSLAQHAPPQVKEDPSLHELPPLVVDGIPTPVEKMTQAQLRAFIPLMLKYSTGRGKPGWGKDSTRPPWWPQDLPWANVRSDARNDEEKQKVSWTHALRQIVINCYKFHGREDLLPAFSEEDEKTNSGGTSSNSQTKEKVKIVRNNTQQPQQQQHHSSISVTNLAAANASIATVPITADSASLATQGVNTIYAQPITHYAPMVQAINSADGSVSIIQMDPTTVVAISDGNGGVRTLSSLRFQASGNEATQGVQTLAEIAAGQDHERVAQISAMNVDLGGEGGPQAVSLAEATIGPDGQIILTGEDGTQSTFPVSGMVTIPVSMYQTVVTNLSLQSENNAIPITMSALTGANQLQGANEGESEEVKAVLNGQNAAITLTSNIKDES
ncbi:DNA-binding protein P3A2 [Sarcoptes scabiei]|uniref:DNA-binding protein P3A2 n=1 Tax=Sarcoptes scabiei TaxID=52283 RepID=A0A834R931_SARSC|nr:DNA-binding protein P3A2 [Sarcoptes scabiei]